MATEIKLRRGTKAQHDDGSGFTGALGEVTVDTTDDTLRVHDGSLKGGHVIAKLSDVQASDTLAEMSDVNLTSPADGSVLKYDNASSKWIDSSKLTETATGINVTGTVTADGVNLADDKTLTMGTSGDFRIYKNASGNAIIHESGSGNLEIRGESGTLRNDANETCLGWNADKAYLYWQGDTGTKGERLKTTATGINVTGKVECKETVAITTTGSGTDPAPDLDFINLHADAIGERLGQINYYGMNDESGSGSGQTKYAWTEVRTIDVTEDSEKAQHETWVKNGANHNRVLTVQPTGIDVTGTVTVSGTVDGRDIATDGTKLDAIEASADVTDTANVVAALTAGTNVSIAGDGTISSTDTTYSVQDGELSQNSFTNDDHTKLNGIEASADVTDTTNVVAALTAGTNIAIAGDGTISATDTTYSVQDGELSQNNFTNEDHTKLNNIEAGADVTDATNVVAALTAGTNITIAGNGTISSTNTTYTGGTGLTLDGTTFNIDAAQAGITSLGTLSSLVLGQNGTVSFEGSTSGDNDTILTVVDPTADRTISLPNASGTVALNGVNQTAYRSGEIIETLRGYADGRTLTGQATTAGAARNIVLEDVTAEQVLSNSYVKVNGTEFDYYPPAGTKTVLVEYQIFIGYDGSDIDPVFHHKIDVDGTVITQTQSTTRQEYRGHVYSVSEAIITVDGSGDLASGNIDSWNAAKTFRVLGREFGASNNVALHRVRIHDGSASATIINEPKIKITAIG